MQQSKKSIGFALCGAYGAFEEALESARLLIEEGYVLTPIFSERACGTETRFGRGENWRNLFELLCDREAVSSVIRAEYWGSKEAFDLLLIVPCTGTTLAKLAHGIADTAVTMAAKCQLEVSKPVLIAPHTTDAFGTAIKHIALGLSRDNIYFVPMRRKDDRGAEHLTADFKCIPQGVKSALAGEQIQPVFFR